MAGGVRRLGWGFLWAALTGSACNGAEPVVGTSNTEAINGSSGVSENLSGLVMPIVEQIAFHDDLNPNGQCLPFKPLLGQDGTPTCKLYGMFPMTCDCSAPGWQPASAEALEALRESMKSTGQCDNGGVACADVCTCEMIKLTGEDAVACASGEPTDPGLSGWCYVSNACANPTLGQPALGMIERIGGARVSPVQTVLITCADELRTSASEPTASAGALGQVCVPDRELDPTFPFFWNAAVEFDSSRCASGVCLLNHFHGRVSCPYGQSEGETACFVPGTSTPVEVAVDPNLVERPRELAATCSCRCAGPGPGPFCECPSGMQCEPMFDAVGLPDEDRYVGSYCVMPGSVYDPLAPFGSYCSRDGYDCGDPQPF